MPWFGALLVVCALLGAPPARSQATVTVGEHVLLANAISSLELTPDVARSSGITRSASRGLLNIAIRRQLPEGGDVPVRAAVTADAVNLTGQRQILSLREVVQGDAVYYLAEPRIVEGEALTFEVNARPHDSTTVLQARFKQTFFAPLPP